MPSISLCVLIASHRVCRYVLLSHYSPTIKYTLMYRIYPVAASLRLEVVYGIWDLFGQRESLYRV